MSKQRRGVPLPGNERAMLFQKAKVGRVRRYRTLRVISRQYDEVKAMSASGMIARLFGLARIRDVVPMIDGQNFPPIQSHLMSPELKRQNYEKDHNRRSG